MVELAEAPPQISGSWGFAQNAQNQLEGPPAGALALWGSPQGSTSSSLWTLALAGDCSLILCGPHGMPHPLPVPESPGSWPNRCFLAHRMQEAHPACPRDPTPTPPHTAPELCSRPSKGLEELGVDCNQEQA